MNAYVISAADRPGLAAALFRAAAARGVNVFPAYGLSDGSRALIAVGSNDEAGLRAAIGDAGLTATPIEMVVVTLENRPGTGAELFGKLADAGVDIRVAVPIGMDGASVQVGLAASDTALLKRTLGV